MNGINVTFTRANFVHLAKYLEECRNKAVEKANDYYKLAKESESSGNYYTRQYEEMHNELCMLNRILEDIYEEDEEDGNTV